ncbi:MAG: hypothetical protein R3220_00370 [Balneolaceae bacterium]|nr:hypothetical protein [Balneolaceae bacterium]
MSKKLVGEIYEEVFNNSLDIDPKKYSGTIVEKSIYNGTNFAAVLEGPVSDADIRADHVYQKKIASSSPYEGLTLVYRVPVHSGEIPIVFLKYRPYKFQFTGTYNKVEMKKPEEVFSPEERSKILSMNKKMGIDYGECDVLRDSDGKMYVVDVNSNPGGPPWKMTRSQKVEATKVLVPSFKKLIEKFAD